VKIVVMSAKGPGMSYVIAKTDMPRFAAAIKQVKDVLASDAPAR